MAHGLTPEDGYGMLGDRVTNGLKNLEAITVEPGSAVADEDAFLKPIDRTFALCTKLPLGSALDHLLLVAETLSSKGQPHAFAESSLVRTAITAASYSLWMLQTDPTTRRARGLQFNFKDFEGYIGFLQTVTDGPALPDVDRAQAAEAIGGLRDRLDWIVEQANALAGAAQTMRQFRNDLPRDTRVVEEAAGILAGDSISPVRVVSPLGGVSCRGYAHGLLWNALGNQVVLS